MRMLILALFTLPLIASAEWKADLSFGVDGDTWNQQQVVFTPGKETAILFSRHQLKLSLLRNKQEGGVDVTYLVQEKKNNTFVVVAKGTENIDDKKQSEIFAKGEPGQPNSIITLKFHP